MVNFYNRFVDNFSEHVQPLLHLTSKKTVFKWNEKESIQFQKIKSLFLETQVLHYPDFSKDFYLQCDASRHSIGGHVYQILDDDKKHALMFISRTLKGPELNYYTSELECLAIVHCLQKARSILIGQRIRIVTDHMALTFLKTCRLLSPRLTRWALALQEYDFTIQHCPGKTISLPIP